MLRSPLPKNFQGGVSSTLCGPKTDTRLFNPGTEVGLGIGPDIGDSFGGRNARNNFRAPASPIRTTFRATTYYGTISALLNIPSVGAVLRCETISSYKFQGLGTCFEVWRPLAVRNFRVWAPVLRCETISS